MFKCPKCGTDKPVKNGFMKGLQRYKCKACCYNYTKSRTGRVSAKIKRNAIRLYLFGMTTREVGKRLNKSHVSVASWVKKAGYKELHEINNDVRVARDSIKTEELQDFVEKRSNQFEYVLTEIDRNSPYSLDVTVMKVL